MTGEEKVWVAEGSLGLVRAVRATYFFARITAFFTGDAVGCQKTVMLFSPCLKFARALCWQLFAAESSHARRAP